MTTPASTPLLPAWMRPAPSVTAGVVIWALYATLLFAIQASSGISYTDWFATGANAWRTAVLSLAVGSVLLAVVVRLWGWDGLWRDPTRLPCSLLLKTVLVLWWLSIGLRLLSVAWGEVPLDLLLPVLLTGVLVGFAEEVLFRGFFLRGMRTGGRDEASAAIWTAVCFGLFHLPNVLIGTGVVGLMQVPLAALSGMALYAFRRRYGVLWPAMLAHGAWDVSTFLAGKHIMPAMGAANLLLMMLMPLLGLALLLDVRWQDRRTVMYPAPAGAP